MEYRKKLYSTLLVVLINLLLIGPLQSQFDIDSMKIALSEAVDQDKAPIMLRLSNEYKIVSQDLSLKYAHDALAFVQKFPNDTLLALVYKTIGVYHHYYVQPDSAIYYNLLALEAYERLGDTAAIGKIYNNLGIFYSDIGLYKNSIDYHLKSLEIKEKFADTAGLSHTYNNIGTLYFDFKNYDSALEYFKKAQHLAQKLNDEVGIQSAYTNLGSIYLEKEEYARALEWFNQALEINNRLNQIYSISANLQNIGRVYYQMGNYDQALDFLLRTQDLNNSYSINSPSTLNTLGQIYDALGNYPQALYYIKKGYDLSVELKDLNHQIFTSENLALLYNHFEEYDKAWMFLNESYQLKDSLNKEIYSRQIGEFSVRMSIEQKEEEDAKLAKASQAGTDSAGFGVFSYQRIALFLGVAFLFILLLYFFERRKKTNAATSNDKTSEEILPFLDILNSSSEYIHYIDSDGRMQEANSAYRKLFDFGDSGLQGKDMEQLIGISPFYADVLRQCYKTNEEVWKLKRPVREVIKIESPNGPVRIIEFEKTPLFNQDNSRKGIITIGKDISNVPGQPENAEGSNEKLTQMMDNSPETDLAKQIVEQLFDAVFYVDTEGAFLDYVINQPYVLPQKNDELRLKGISEKVFPKEIVAGLISSIKDVLETEAGNYFTYRHKDESLPELEAFIRPYGTDQAIILVRKKNQENVPQSEFVPDDHEDIFLSLPYPNLIIDGKGEILNVNYAGISLFGVASREELLNQDFSQFIDATKEGIGLKDFSSLGKNEKVEKIQLHNSKKQAFTAEIKIRTIDYRGHTDALFVSVRDITPQLKLKADLKEANKKIQETDKFNPFFLANLSHEIRTPMNSIIGFANLLSEQSISDEQKTVYIKNINQSGNSLLHLIEDIIDVSKIESGQITLSEEICYLNKTFSEFYNNFSEMNSEQFHKDIDFKVRLGVKDADFAIITDEFRFKQIMSNIISNAFQFTSSGSIEIGYLLPDEKNIRFYVKDTGIGISQEKQELIFDRFNLVDESATRVFGGAGLGLTISKSLVNLMDGQIFVDSEEGRGSHFYFTLPYRPVSNQDAPDSEYDMPPDKVFDFAGKKILIAEDVEPNYQLVKSFLRKTHADLIWAKDGKEAVELCKKQKMDLVVMDIQMPVLNGFEAMKIIKEMDKDLPIIAQTAYAMIDDRPKIIAEGFDEYISKPLKAGLFLSMIDKFLK